MKKTQTVMMKKKKKNTEGVISEIDEICFVVGPSENPHFAVAASIQPRMKVLGV